MKHYTLISAVLVVLLAIGLYSVRLYHESKQIPKKIPLVGNVGGKQTTKPHPLSIESLRQGHYAGSAITIEEELSPGSNYRRYIASYQSEGLKIHSLLTVPNGSNPQDGWPVIIFNHGYIPPREYQTAERYIAYTDAFSSAGYILFKPDYRGHGNSEGSPSGYGSNAYSIDVLNAVASIKKFAVANPQKIGMWGHSMGGYITLRNMVARKDVKAGVIWAGVVAPYPDLLNWHPSTGSSAPITRRGFRQRLLDELGPPDQNRQQWDKLSANSYLKDISGPLQLQHGTDDADVPLGFSETLHQRMKEVGKLSELFVYPGDNHNLSGHLSLALIRSVEFFNRYLK